MNGANGSTTFTDSSSASRTIARYGATISTAEFKFGGSSGSFDGNNDFIDIASSPDYVMTGDFTIEGWFRYDNLNDNRTIISQWPNATPINGQWEVFILTNGKLRFDYETSGGRIILLSSNTMTASTWTHFAAVRNGSSVVLYVNGTSVATATNSDTVGINDSVNIGRKEYDGGNDYFDGFLEEIRVTKGVARYTSNFTPQSREFYPGTGVDDITSNNISTFINNASLYMSSQPYYYDFDRTSAEYIEVPTNGTLPTLAEDFTLLTWVYIDSAEASSNAYNGILSMGLGTGTNGTQVTFRKIRSGISNQYNFLNCCRIIRCFKKC